MSELVLTVGRVHAETAAIRTLELYPLPGETLPAFTPGAHLQVQIPGLSDIRSYSLVVFPNESGAAGGFSAPSIYRLGVRLESPGRGGSHYMHALASGARITVSSPRNDFELHAAEPGEKPVVLLAGGIGITPILSMAAELRAANRPFVLHYSGRSRDQLAYLDALKQTVGEALVIHADDEPEHRLDIPTLLKSYTPDQHLYVCGPKGMIDAMIEHARQQGWSSGCIHFELFTAATAQVGDQPFELELRQSGTVLTVASNQTILEAMEVAGCDPMYDCKRGECGVCTATVLEGEPDHRDYFLSDAEKASGKLIQICISRAKSARLVLDL